MLDVLSSRKLRTPFTIGIFGPWGTGKSSFMVQLKASLEESHNAHTVLFQPWLFDDKEEVWKAHRCERLNGYSGRID